MPNQLNQVEKRTAAALLSAREDVSHLEQMYHQLSRKLMDRLDEMASELAAVTQERDRLRGEVERLKASLTESATDLELYRLSVLALTRRPVTFTPQELEEAQQTLVSSEELMAEIQKPEGA